MLEITPDQAAASAGMYRLLFEHSPHPVLIAERASLRILRANEAAARQSGYPLAELLELPLSRVWPTAEAALLQRSVQPAVAPAVHDFVDSRGNAIQAAVKLQDVVLAGRPAIALHLAVVSDDRLSADLLQAQGRVLEMVACGTPLATVLEALVRAMEQLSKEAIASVLLADEDGRHARHGAAPSLPREYWKAVDGLPIAPSAGSCGTAMYLNRPVATRDIATDPLWDDYRALALPHGLRSCWSIPIRSSAGKVLGAFAIYYREPGEPRDRDRRLVDAATHVAAVAIERDGADRTLLRAEAQLWAIIDHACAAIWLKDLDGRYLLVNRRFEQITGIPAAVARGRTDRQLFPQRLAEAYSANDREVLDTRKGIVFEEEIDQPDGTHAHLAIKFPLLHPGGAAHGIGAILCDISERKRAQEALERSREEMRALAVRLQRVREEERARISGEIHDDLAQALVSLQMSHSVLARSVREEVPGGGRIADELDSMKQAVAGILESVRRIAMDLRPEALDRLGLAAAIEWQGAEFSRRTGIACRVSLPGGAVPADAERSTALFRILQEALSNVARHAGASEVEVALRMDGAFVEMSVADNGRGIADSAGSGMGSLGLLGMSERAAALGGSVTVARAPGGGTRLTARIRAG